MTQRTMYVRPAKKGLVIRDPNSGRRLPPEGALVPRSRFWLRRLADESCTEATRPGTKSAPESTTSEEG